MNETQLAEFFSGLSATHKTASELRKIYNRDLALEFNPLLELFHVNENKFSKIIAYFLNPEAAHGQGDAFLKVFLKQFGFETNKKLQGYESVNVVCEHPTHEGRRLDIYLRFLPNNFGLGIENKIWAGGQQGQLTDYNAYLAGQHGDNYCLLYWRPYDVNPEEHSIPEAERKALESSGHFCAFNHMDNTSDLVEEWISVCRAENVRTFLKHFYQNIQHEINREKFMGEHDTTAKFLSESAERLNLALSVTNAMDTVYADAIEKLKERVRQISARHQIKLEEYNVNHAAAGKNSSFTFRFEFKNRTPLFFKFEFEEKNLEGFFYGFLSGGEKNVVLEDELAMILESCADDKPTRWWSWWQYFPDANTSAQTLWAIFNGRLAEEIERIVVDVKGKLEKAFA